MFRNNTFFNLRWVKNVKRDNGSALAYFDPEMEFEFNLNFSESQKKANEHLEEGDVILLFQRIDKVKGIKPKTYLTHLVTPIDTEMVFNTDNREFPYEKRVVVIARADPRTTQAISSPSHILNFHKPNWGKLCSIKLLNENLPEENVKSVIWSYFKNQIISGWDTYIIQAKSQLSNMLPEEFNALEGQEREEMMRHIIRERNPELIRRAKSFALLKGNGRIICECCRFDFLGFYGQHGYGFIECHHRKPIASGGERVTKIDDLAMLCANCHRMLHRKNIAGSYFSITDLKTIIEQS